jgi:hypothetical protein
MLEYRMCEKFGWTPQEFAAQPYEKIEKFAVIMDQEIQRKKANSGN